MVRVSKFHDKKPVLKDIQLSYFYGAKIGVLGLNGSGKTSLLKILAGVDENFNGETHIAPGHTVGLLEQEPRLDEEKTVKEIVEEGAQEVVDLMAPLVREQGIGLDVELDRNLKMFFFDPELIHRCLLNLVTNALDACKSEELRRHPP